MWKVRNQREPASLLKTAAAMALMMVLSASGWGPSWATSLAHGQEGGQAAPAQSAEGERSNEAQSTPPHSDSMASNATEDAPSVSTPAKGSNRLQVLIGSLTVFVLAIFVGFEVINKVPPTLHTPLMSGSNAISGITIVGAIIATGMGRLGFASFLGLCAIILAMINVAGGFWVTHRMLAMFKKRKSN